MFLRNSRNKLYLTRKRINTNNKDSLGANRHTRGLEQIAKSFWIIQRNARDFFSNF